MIRTFFNPLFSLVSVLLVILLSTSCFAQNEASEWKIEYSLEPTTYREAYSFKKDQLTYVYKISNQNDPSISYTLRLTQNFSKEQNRDFDLQMYDSQGIKMEGRVLNEIGRAVVDYYHSLKNIFIYDVRHINTPQGLAKYKSEMKKAEIRYHRDMASSLASAIELDYFRKLNRITDNRPASRSEALVYGLTGVIFQAMGTAALVGAGVWAMFSLADAVFWFAAPSVTGVLWGGVKIILLDVITSVGINFWKTGNKGRKEAIENLKMAINKRSEVHNLRKEQLQVHPKSGAISWRTKMTHPSLFFQTKQPVAEAILAAISTTEIQALGPLSMCSRLFSFK